VASKARVAFDANCKDVDRLLEIHGTLGGDKQGRRFQLEVLNKSAIVLVSAIWEAYCEDIVAEAVEHLIAVSQNAAVLPTSIKKIVAKELKEDKNELAIWEVADNGWKNVLQSRLKRMQESRARKLNTPKSEQIRNLFHDVLGIDDITEVWYWPKMSSTQAAAKLDAFISMRGEIAHRGAVERAVSKQTVVDFLNHVQRLVRKTGKSVNRSVKDATGESLFEGDSSDTSETSED